MCPEPETESAPRRFPYPLLVLVFTLGLIAFISLIAVQKVRHQSRKVACSNNLKQLGLAAQMYRNDHRIFPYAFGEGEERSPIRAMIVEEYIDDPENLVCPVTGKPYRFNKDVKTDGDPSTDFILICRHEDGANVLYLQGNVKWVPSKELERR